jgi:hypothetical protein
MATYSTSTHHLAFTTDYKSLKVIATGDNSVVATFLLDTSSQSTSLHVTAGNFVVNVAEDFGTYTHGVDLDAGATLSFPSANRMGGLGVIDLRDINGAISIAYDLACTTFRMKYVDDTPAFWLKFDGSECFEYTEL